MSQMNMQNMLGMTPEQMEIARKTRYAEALRRQSEEPMQGQMVSGHYVAPSWTQGLAKMLSAYGSGKMERDAAEAAKAYGEQQRTDFTDTAAKYAQALRGTPEQQTAYEADNPFGEDLGNLQTVTPGRAGSADDALAIAIQSKSQPWQQFAMQNMLAQAKGANDTAEMRNWRFAQSLSEADRAAFLAKSGTMPSSVQEWEYFNKLSPEQKAAYLEMKRNPQIMNLGGTMAVRAPGGGVGESYAVTPKPEAMPTFKGAQAKAEAEAKAGVASAAEAEKKGKTADQLISNIDEAEKILNEGKATGSLIGTGIAAVKGAVGVSDTATKANQQLKLISGWMVANVPRMEGPQSNFDVQNYREMAAMVGDSTIPIGDRLSALKQLRQLQQKYKNVQTGSPGNRPPLDSLWD